MNQMLLELADRCEKAEGPDRAIDCQIAAIFGPDRGGESIASLMADDIYMGRENGREWTDEEWALLADGIGAAPYTASLDAAMTLVPEGWAYALGNFDPDDETKGIGKGAAIVGETAGSNVDPCYAATPARALCAAALRARASNPEGGQSNG